MVDKYIIKQRIISLFIILVFIISSLIVLGVAEKKQIFGLETALSQVTNENAKAKLQINLERLNEFSDKVIGSNDKFVVAERKGKFLGLFNVKRTHIYDIQESGNLVRRQKFTDFLFKKEQKIIENG